MYKLSATFVIAFILLSLCVVTNMDRLSLKTVDEICEWLNEQGISSSVVENFKGILQLGVKASYSVFAAYLTWLLMH